jgi:signal transduction histidine kinase/putative methionine-R-sulfoxide reductase with GAF domain
MDTDKSKEQLIQELHKLRRQVDQLTETNQTLQAEHAEHRRTAEELEALRRLTLDISSQLHLETLLFSLVEYANNALNADQGGIYLYRPERNVLEAMITVRGSERFKTSTELQVGEGLSGKVWQRRESLIVEDYSNWQGRASIYEDASFRAVMGVPIQWGEEFLGVINAAMLHETERTFSQRDLRFLELFANQAAIAIRNAQLFETNQRRTEQLDTLRQITLNITGQLDLNTLLSVIIREAVDLLDAYGGGIGLLRPEKNVLEWAIGINLDYIPIGLEIPRGVGMVGQVWERGEPVIIENYSAWKHHMKGFGGYQMQAAVGAPIQWRGEFLGALGVTRRGEHYRKFYQRDAELLQLLANQAAIAIQNARLYEQVQRHAQELEGRVQARTGELERANRELQKLSHIKDEFVSNVSHELRTPITSLKIRQHLLIKQPERLDYHLAVVRRETDRLEALIEDLLNLSRLDQERAAFDLIAVDLNHLCREYVADRLPLAATKNLTLTYSEAPDVPVIQGDDRLLGQVLSILLTNALNYTPAGGTVTVETAKRQNSVHRWVGFTVSDTGPGIQPDEQEKLFTRFFRGEAGRKSGAPGTGLGLAIADEIVRRHKGTIEIESSGVPGEGARFIVWLPG